MRWLDPPDCVAAQDCLDRGNELEAARLLLESPDRHHRAACRLLMDLSQRLVKRAAEARDRGDLVAAAELIDCAGQCADLQGDGAALRQQIARQQNELQQQQAWCQDRLQRARDWARLGHLRSAISLLRPLDQEGEAARLKADLEASLGRLQRYVQQGRECLEQDDLTGATESLRKAYELCPDDPQVVQLARALRETAREKDARVCSRERPDAPRVGPRALRDRSQTFAISDNALIVPSHEAVLGSPLGDSVHIPIQSRIHRRHALLVRDGHTYRLLPYARCAVAVNGVSVAGLRELEDGDVIELGDSYCRWRFRRPVADSATAVLDQAAPGAAWIQTRNGGRFRRAVLLDDRVEIRPQDPAHVEVSELPCRALALRWTPQGVTLEAQGGTVTMGSETEVASDGAPLLLVPSRVLISPELDEVDWIASLLMHRNDAARILELMIHDPS